MVVSICLIGLSACANTASTTRSAEPAPPSATVVEPGPVELAMTTVAELVAGGNTQTAIDRLTQLLGDASLSEEDRARVHYERGLLRRSESGFDVMGAVADFGTVIDAYPVSESAVDARSELDAAKKEARAITDTLNRPETSRTARFESLFRLGQHNEALDLMLSHALKPDNQHLIAMYQIGYLCTDDGQTGPSYAAVEPDGTERNLRFCDFGK